MPLKLVKKYFKMCSLKLKYLTVKKPISAKRGQFCPKKTLLKPIKDTGMTFFKV